MVILIVAGGKGTRLWPISTADYPKQLISVVKLSEAKKVKDAT